MATIGRHPELVEKLTEGIASLAGSAQWRHHLEFQSRFHRYSFGNVVLIATQRPEATWVAGFNAWRRLGRWVRKGESAIWILAPMTYRRRDGEGTDETPVIRGFKFIPVFDISQTDGAEPPEVCTRLEGDDPACVYGRLVSVASSVGFSVQDHDFGSAVNGDCDHRSRTIRVEVANKPAQRVKTLAHEIAHALLHADFEDRALAELEAESTAYVVCQALGIDSGRYSFGYLATWAGGGDAAIAAIRASCQRIQAASASILGTSELSELQARAS